MLSKSLGCGSQKFARLRDEHPTVGLFAQALYPLLVANSDDFGRQQGDAFTVKHAVWSTAPDDESVFEAALVAMHSVGLIQRYEVGGRMYLQVIDFDEHQLGLHKRTSSNFPEIPGNSRSRARAEPNLREEEQNRTEPNPTEENGTEPKQNQREFNRREPRVVDRRSKHPVFKGERFVVFDWMLEDLERMLGPYADGFAFDLWFDEMSHKAVKEQAVRKPHEWWPWLQEQLIETARAKGWSVATTGPELDQRTKRNLAAAERFAGRKPERIQ